MSRCDYTAGPWRLGQPAYRTGHETMYPVICRDGSDELGIRSIAFAKLADAQLIVASPDLYEAACHVLAVPLVVFDYITNDEIRQQMTDAYNMLVRAINKAEGRT